MHISFIHTQPDTKRLNNDLVLSRSLLVLTKDVDVPARLVWGFVSRGFLVDGGEVTLTSSVRSVVTSPVIAQGANLLHLLIEQLDLLEVVADARGGDGLGNDTVAADLGPGETVAVSWVVGTLGGCGFT